MALVGEGEQRCNLVDVESTWLTAARLRNKFARLVGGACSGEEAEVAWAKYAENLLARAAAVRKIEFGTGMAFLERAMEEAASQQLTLAGRLSSLFARTTESHQQRLAAVGAALEALEKEKTTVAQQEKARSEDISKAEKAIQKSRAEASKLRAVVHEDTKTVRMLLAGTT